ncbi:hypothetical protein T492DRAFT_1067584 [Pavlovales sp. CCMP2436]|nr:hypothetical protein T492DRAFT_1067584 [Pavlovales sp. CCMP2436]
MIIMIMIIIMIIIIMIIILFRKITELEKLEAVHVEQIGHEHLFIIIIISIDTWIIGSLDNWIIGVSDYWKIVIFG